MATIDVINPATERSIGKITSHANQEGIVAV